VQREQFERLGVMGDWADPYLTMKYEAEATIVAELLKFAESGQIYRGAKPVMWSPVEKTALAEAEVEYEDIVSTQIDVAFEIVGEPDPGAGRRPCGDLDDDARGRSRSTRRSPMGRRLTIVLRSVLGTAT
jgi:isoleucyl-tRNA synthetase